MVSIQSERRPFVGALWSHTRWHWCCIRNYSLRNLCPLNYWFLLYIQPRRSTSHDCSFLEWAWSTIIGWITRSFFLSFTLWFHFHFISAPNSSDERWRLATLTSIYNWRFWLFLCIIFANLFWPKLVLNKYLRLDITEILFSDFPFFNFE